MKPSQERRHERRADAHAAGEVANALIFHHLVLLKKQLTNWNPRNKMKHLKKQLQQEIKLRKLFPSNIVIFVKILLKHLRV